MHIVRRLSHVAIILYLHATHDGSLHFGRILVDRVCFIWCSLVQEMYDSSKKLAPTGRPT